MAIRWAAYLELNPGKVNTWDCSYCEEKGLQVARNCDSIVAGQCKEHGEIQFESLIEDENSGKLKCPLCDKPVQMPFQLKLGKRYWLWSCPIQHVNEADIRLIRFINWAEALGQAPSGKALYDESNLYFEIRDFILREQYEARRELEELLPKKDQRASTQGSVSGRVPKKLPRKR